MLQSFKGPAKRSDSRPSSSIARSEQSPADTLGEARWLRDLQIKDIEAQIALQQEWILSMEVSLDAAKQHAEAMTVEMEKQKMEIDSVRMVEASEIELLRQLKAVESEQHTAAERLERAKIEIIQLKTQAEITSERRRAQARAHTRSCCKRESAC